jgi:hypothetical protein
LQEVNKEREAKLGVCSEGEGDDRSGGSTVSSGGAVGFSPVFSCRGRRRKGRRRREEGKREGWWMLGFRKKP